MNPVDRRQFLRTSGLVVSMGALVAACGSNRGGPTSPGRIGIAPPAATLPTAEVTDLTVLRTAQSLEYSLLAVYEALAAQDVYDDVEAALAERMIADHTAHAAAFGELITSNGGEEFACANPFFMDRTVNPVLAALEGSDDVHRDVMNIAHGFEAVTGASYQALISRLDAPAIRKAITVIGGEEHRHATVLARTINTNQTFAPSFFGETSDPDSDGFIVVYGIPSVFGRVNGIDLVVGKLSAEGTRFSTQLQTPAENTFAYEYQSC